MIHKIDAKGRTIGRIASEAAVLLMGKNRSDFARNKVSSDKVEIINANQVKITAERAAKKNFIWYTGYPGGLKKENLSTRMNRKGIANVFEEAIFGMLPKNKLRARMMKNLSIKE